MNLELSVINKISLSTSPEIIEKSLINNKNDIWSLGILIYYFLFREFPFNGEMEYILHKNIIFSNNKFKLSDDEELNDLLKKMLTININHRISWNDYFNHSFFQNNKIYFPKIKFPEFNLFCQNHFKQFNYYCVNCKINLCEICLKNHSKNTHQIISFSKKGFLNKPLKAI